MINNPNYGNNFLLPEIKEKKKIIKVINMVIERAQSILN